MSADERMRRQANAAPQPLLLPDLCSGTAVAAITLCAAALAVSLAQLPPLDPSLPLRYIRPFLFLLWVGLGARAAVRAAFSAERGNYALALLVTCCIPLLYGPGRLRCRSTTQCTATARTSRNNFALRVHHCRFCCAIWPVAAQRSRCWCRTSGSSGAPAHGQIGRRRLDLAAWHCRSSHCSYARRSMPWQQALRRAGAHPQVDAGAAACLMPALRRNRH